MSEATLARRNGRNRRTNYLIDRPLQLSITFAVVGVLTVVALLCVVAIMVLPDGRQLDGVSGERLRTIILVTTAAYFTLASGSVAVAAVLITHRVAGPAMVLEQAVDEFRAGNLSPRLRLRPKDYLQELAESMSALGADIGRQRDAWQGRLEQIVSALQTGDSPRVESLIEEARATYGAPEEWPIASGEVTPT